MLANLDLRDAFVERIVSARKLETRWRGALSRSRKKHKRVRPFETCSNSETFNRRIAYAVEERFLDARPYCPDIRGKARRGRENESRDTPRFTSQIAHGVDGADLDSSRFGTEGTMAEFSGQGRLSCWFFQVICAREV